MEIPKDIAATARRVYDKLGRGVATDEGTIALAIMAERAWCAKIAAKHGWCGGGAVVCGGEIAAAIRTPSTGEEQ